MKKKNGTKLDDSQDLLPVDMHLCRLQQQLCRSRTNVNEYSRLDLIEPTVSTVLYVCVCNSDYAAIAEVRVINIVKESNSTTILA